MKENRSWVVTKIMAPIGGCFDPLTTTRSNVHAVSGSGIRSYIFYSPRSL
jgi:hypothetical protein